jgi:hypothetical protein
MLALEMPQQQQEVKPYRQLLRPFGAFFNQLQARYITLAETATGFAWHCYPRGDLAHARGGLVCYADIPALLEMLRRERAGRGLFGLRRGLPRVDPRSFRRHPICPVGYQEMLRSLGAKLDEQRAHAVLIMERDDHVLVRYSMPLPIYIRTDAYRATFITGMHEDVYRPDHLMWLVARARSRRGSLYYI